MSLYTGFIGPLSLKKVKVPQVGKLIQPEITDSKRRYLEKWVLKNSSDNDKRQLQKNISIFQWFKIF